MRLKCEPIPWRTAGDLRPGLRMARKTEKWAGFPGIPLVEFLNSTGATRAMVRAWEKAGLLDPFDAFFHLGGGRAVRFYSKESVERYNARHAAGDFERLARLNALWDDPDEKIASAQRVRCVKYRGKTFCNVARELRLCTP